MSNGDVVLLENVRFIPGEETNNQDFARELSSLADLIGTLPDEIGNLQKLKDLTLSYNYDMSGTLPSSIWTLSQLEDLEIEHLGLDLYVTLTSDIESA